MATPAQEKRFILLFNHGKAKGLTDLAALAYALLAWNWELFSGEVAPPITSGRRSYAHQLRLREKWELGERRGLVVKPALRSTHVTGTGFDIRQGSHTEFFAAGARFFNIRWGGDFSTPDPVHFDIRSWQGSAEV